MDGMGGINIQNIMLGMELYKVPEVERGAMLGKVIKIAKLINAKGNKSNG